MQLHIVEADSGYAPGLVESGLRVTLHPGGVGGYGKQPDPSLTDTARGAGSDNQHIAVGPIDHMQVLTVEPVAASAALCVHLHGGVIPAWSAGVSQAGCHFTRRNQWQPMCLEGFVAAQQQRGQGQAAGGVERRRQQAPAQLFLQQAHFDKAQPQATIGLGDGQGRPVQLTCNACPGSRVVTLFAGHGRTHFGGTGHLGQKAFGRRLNHSLLVRQGKLHRAALLAGLRIMPPA